VPFGVTINETLTSLSNECHSFSERSPKTAATCGHCHQVLLSPDSCQRGGKNAICTHSVSLRLLLCISPHAKGDRNRRWRSMIYDSGHRFCNKYVAKRLLGKLRASQNECCSFSKDTVLAAQPKAYKCFYNACGYIGILACRLGSKLNQNILQIFFCFLNRAFR
jgi:hypothetical protein